MLSHLVDGGERGRRRFTVSQIFQFKSEWMSVNEKYLPLTHTHTVTVHKTDAFNTIWPNRSSLRRHNDQIICLCVTHMNRFCRFRINICISHLPTFFESRVYHIWSPSQHRQLLSWNNTNEKCVLHTHSRSARAHLLPFCCRPINANVELAENTIETIPNGPKNRDTK